MELAPRLEQQLQIAGIALPAQKIRDALVVENFETQGIRPDGRGFFIDRQGFVSEMRVLRSYFAVEKQNASGLPNRRGPTSDPENDRIESQYRENGNGGSYHDIAEALELKVWKNRTPYKRVEMVINALHQREKRAVQKKKRS